ncbi:MAG: chemotaxis protein CheW [Peptococcaceae bacterium]|nr:chemotaxis protein CheW [Peptococcaceae bacterium]
MNENTAISADAIDELKGRFLLFYLDDTLYGVELRLVLEIINIQHITHLPGVPDHIKGIVNLRGKIVPVIEVRRKFNMPDKDYTDKTCIIVLEIQGMQIGLIVDQVSEVVTVEPKQIASPPSMGDATNRYLSSVSEIGSRYILNIDFDKFFQKDLEMF